MDVPCGEKSNNNKTIPELDLGMCGHEFYNIIIYIILYTYRYGDR
jgi:hypothetical protein